MPQFTSSFIVASDIRVYFPGLGVWNDSDTDNQTNNAVNILMKYTYAPNLGGGYGPFSFVPADGAINNVHSFRVERSRGGILLTVPGAQVIGYISTVIPKFPYNQTSPTNSTACLEPPSSSGNAQDSPTGTNRRRRRSVEENNPKPPDIMQLAKTLFSERLSASDSYLHKNGLLTPTERVHTLMDEVAHSKERVLDFMETLDADGKGRRITLHQQDPASPYQNGTAGSISQPVMTSR